MAFETQGSMPTFRLPTIQNFLQAKASPWVKKQLRTLSYHAGLHPTLHPFVQHEAVILMYHKVQRRSVGLWQEPVLGVNEFAAQLEFLTRHFEVVPLRRMIRALKKEATLPKRAVAITFDDGYRHNLLLAAPLLKRYRAPATFFVATGLLGTSSWMWAYELEEMFLRFPAEDIAAATRHQALIDVCREATSKGEACDQTVEWMKHLPNPELQTTMNRLRGLFPVEVDDENRFLNWEETRALNADGFEVGAHSVNHPILTRVPLDEAEFEIRQSQIDIEEYVGVRPTLFAYPNGDTSPEITALVGKYFEASVSTRPGVCNSTSPILELPRVAAPVSIADLSFELSRHMLSGTGGPLRQAQGERLGVQGERLGAQGERGSAP